MLLSVVSGLAGCVAEPPSGNGGQFYPPRTGDPHFGDVATCRPSDRPEDCSHRETCGRSTVATVEPDGQAVDLALCTLELSFTRGIVNAIPGAIDLLVHLGSTPTGIARVEASEGGLGEGTFQLVGFINGLPPENPNPRCLLKCASRRCTSAQDSCAGLPCWRPAGDTSFGYCLAASCGPGHLALADLSSGALVGAPETGCNNVFNATVFRISQYAGPNGVSSGSVTIDAVEASAGSFQPRRDL